MLASFVVRVLCVVLACCVAAANAQLTVPKCLCSTVEPCKQQIFGAIQPCAETCKDRFSNLGNVAAIRSCVQEREASIRSTIQCVVDTPQNSCSNTPGFMVRKRNIATLKLALTRQLIQVFSSWGVQSYVDELVQLGNSLFGCMHACIGRSSGNCEKNLNCGLELPSDNELAQNIINCAGRNGFNSAGVKSLCNCLVLSGASKFAPVCPRIPENRIVG